MSKLKQNEASSTRSSPLTELKKQWNLEVGNKIWDVHSETEAVKHHQKGLCFDKEFLDEQRSTRNLVIEKQLASNFLREIEILSNRQYNSEKRKSSALGHVQPKKLLYETDPNDDININSTEDIVVNEATPIVNDEHHCDNDYLQPESVASVSNTFTASIIKTRQINNGSCNCHFKTTSTTGSQTDDDFVENCRVKGKGCRGWVLCPNYLKSMLLMMDLAQMTPRQAILSTYLNDTVVHKKERLLPLELDKEYEIAVNTLESLKSKSINDLQTKTLEETIEKKKHAVFSKTEKTLPTRKALSSNNHLMAVYVEKRIADEMAVKGDCQLQHDGTTRGTVGQVGATLIELDGKFRALPIQQIGSGTKINWAGVFCQSLKRLQQASGRDKIVLWKCVKLFTQDLCQSTKGVSKEVARLLGTDYIPGDAFCNLHYTIAVQLDIKDVMLSFQTKIGGSKIFPTTTGFDMVMETTNAWVQILDLGMRLTDDSFKSRTWNYHDSFVEQLLLDGKKAVGGKLHGARFGEFEIRLGEGVYLLPSLEKWLDNHPEVRNSITCHLRACKGLFDQCSFMWLGGALVGIHVTQPIIEMLLTHKVTQAKLCDIWPQVFQNLLDYPLTFTDLTRCGVPALTKFWGNPKNKATSSLPLPVVEFIEEYMTSIDLKLMDLYIKQITTKMAATLKRQRGDQYGFSDLGENDPANIKNQMPPSMLDSHLSTTTKPVENFFGNIDYLFKIHGSNSFKQVSDALVVKYSSDYALEADASEWQSKENRKRAKEIDECQAEFTQAQKRLISHGVSQNNAVLLTQDNKVLRVTAQCKKSHNGPMFNAEELYRCLEGKTDAEKDKIVNLEIRFRKFTAQTMKESCSLFKQRKVDLEQKINNLCLLFDATDISHNASSTMEDLEAAIRALGQHEQEFEDVMEDDEIHVPPEPEPPIATDLPLTAVLDSWAPKVGEYIIGLFESGVSAGQVLAVYSSNDSLTATFMQTIPESRKDLRFWKFPRKEDVQTIHKNSVLPVHPTLDLDPLKTTSRNIVFELKNAEVVRLLAE